MPFFKKKPVVIEAIQYTGENYPDIKNFCKCAVLSNNGKVPYLIIPTLEGDHQADIGDWIIKGVKGEFYPCKPDIFKITYEEHNFENNKMNGENFGLTTDYSLWVKNWVEKFPSYIPSECSFDLSYRLFDKIEYYMLEPVVLHDGLVYVAKIIKFSTIKEATNFFFDKKFKLRAVYENNGEIVVRYGATHNA